MKSLNEHKELLKEDWAKYKYDRNGNIIDPIKKFNITRAKKEWGKLKNKTFDAMGITWKFSAPKKSGDSFHIKFTNVKDKEDYVDVFASNREKFSSKLNLYYRGDSFDQYKETAKSEMTNDQSDGMYVKGLNEKTGSEYSNFDDIKPLAYGISKYFKDSKVFDQISSIAPETIKKVTKKQLKDAQETIDDANIMIRHYTNQIQKMDDILQGKNWSGGSLSARDFDRYNPMGNSQRRELDRRTQSQEEKNRLQKNIEIEKEEIEKATKLLKNLTNTFNNQ